MTWGKIEGSLHSHPKWLAAPKGAKALWVTALSWSMQQGTDGAVPPGALRALDGTKAEAERLVAAGLWERTEDGYRFHAWDRYQTSTAELEAARVVKVAAAELGNHTRWHERRGAVDPECRLCRPVVDGSHVRSQMRSPRDRPRDHR
ncbi:MAG: hypothetical protein FWD18_00405 [Micrococcales bacterium]|nr:hypothetical protein [Micrococcales bacterium]